MIQGGLLMRIIKVGIFSGCLSVTVSASYPFSQISMVAANNLFLFVLLVIIKKEKWVVLKICVVFDLKGNFGEYPFDETL